MAQVLHGQNVEHWPHIVFFCIMPKCVHCIQPRLTVVYGLLHKFTKHSCYLCFISTHQSIVTPVLLSFHTDKLRPSTSQAPPRSRATHIQTAETSQYKDKRKLLKCHNTMATTVQECNSMVCSIVVLESYIMVCMGGRRSLINSLRCDEDRHFLAHLQSLDLRLTSVKRSELC